LETMGGKIRTKRKNLLLSDEDRAIGFYIMTDRRDNIALLKQGRRIAWFSASLSKEMVKAVVTLVKEFEREIGKKRNKPNLPTQIR